MIALGLAQLEGYSSHAGNHTIDGLQTIPNAVLYFQVTVDRFTQEGLDVLTASQTIVSYAFITLGQ